MRFHGCRTVPANRSVVKVRGNHRGSASTTSATHLNSSDDSQLALRVSIRNQQTQPNTRASRQRVSR